MPIVQRSSRSTLDASERNKTPFSGASGDSSVGNYQAFLYSGGAMMPLPIVPGSAVSYGYAINDSAQITGTTYLSGNGQVFLYSGGATSLLAPFQDIHEPSEGFSINSQGQIADVQRDSAGNFQAQLFGPGAGPLVFLPGGTTSAATAINAGG